MRSDLEGREEIRDVLMPLARGTDRRDGIIGLRYMDRFARREGGAWLSDRRICMWDHACSVRHERWTLGPSYIPRRNDRQDPSYER